MELHIIMLISLQIIYVVTKKYDSSSDESIENLLYFKDCQKNKEASSTSPPFERYQAPPQPKPMDCPFPKMCCSITCGGNECAGPTSPFMGMGGTEQFFPPMKQVNSPLQPRVQPTMSRVRKKKAKQPIGLQMSPMMSTRRDFGFTKDRIKNLINQDDDIRKILKDLVRVTMQKVDLVEMINTRRQGVSVAPPRLTPKNSENEEYDDDDLE